MTFRPPRSRSRKPPPPVRRAPAPTRAEYHVPGGTIVFTSRQWPPWIAIRFDGERMGARRSYGEAEELLAEYAGVDPERVARVAEE